MSKKFIAAQKIFSVFASFNLILQSALGSLLFSPRFSFAQEVTPTPVEEVIVVETPVVEVTEVPAEPTAIPTEILLEEPTPTPTPTPEITITPEPTPVPTENPTLIPTPSPTVTPGPVEKECLDGQEIKDSVNEDWNVDTEKGLVETKEKVKLGVKYVFPLENKVSITFKCLPKDEGLRTPLKIQQVKVSDLKLPEGTNPATEFAYDITTGMQDGDFEYDVTLPKPENSTAEVSYIEKSIDDAKTNEITSSEIKQVEENKLEQEGETVRAIELDHFTIYITTYGDIGLAVSESVYLQGDTVFLKSTGLGTGRFYRVDIFEQGGVVRHDVVACTTGVTTLSGSYTLGATAPIGSSWSAVLTRYNSLGDCISRIDKKETATDMFGVKATNPASLVNPTISPDSCGLDIALVIDNSNSIDSSELSQMKTALISFVTALAGTPTQFSVTKFGTNASVVQGFTSIAADVISAINSVGTGGGGTNWKDGIATAKGTFDPRASKPNLMIFASDGNPTYPGNGHDTTPENVNAAVTEANIAKSSPLNIRILALGIGDGLLVENLKAISGHVVNASTVLGSDVVTTDFSTMASQLAAFASQTCGGTITVNKYYNDTSHRGGTGWTFDVAGNTKTTDSNGQTEAVNVSAGSTVSVTETGLVLDYTFGSASCKNTQTLAPVGTPDNANKRVTGIILGDSDIVSCDFINTTNPYCGDGQVGPGETCEGIQTQACQAGDYNGLQTCSACQWGSCVPTESCGDGIKNGLEECDGTDGVTPHHVCTNTCTLEYVPYCGDQTVDPGEECDGDSPRNCSMPTNGYAGTQSCDNSVCLWNPCQPNQFCGDGAINGPETCDDGILNGTYGYCNSLCTGQGEYCGDGIKNGNEQCDGTNGVPSGYTCSGSCTLVRNTGTITVDKVTNPTGDTTDFNFNLSSTDTGANQNFTLKDQDAPYNDTYDTGIYVIEEKTLPVGWNLTNLVCDSSASIDTNTHTAQFDLDNNENITCTFTNTKLGSISGIKWEDMNGNGVRDVGDNPISGWTINLDKDANGTTDQTTTTDVNGIYTFNNLLSGTYKVLENTPSPWNVSHPSLGINYYNGIVLAAGENLVDYDFGNYKNGKIEGFKWEDADGDGVKDAGETAPANQWGINLWKEVNGIKMDEGIVYTQLDGSYSFGRAPGTYYLSEIAQPGWVKIYPNTEFLGPIVVTSGSISGTNNFGNFENVSVTACKEADPDGLIGTPDGRTNVAGWHVNLMIDGLPTSAQVTGADGCYTWTNLGPGHYGVGESVSPGWTNLTGTTHDFGTVQSGSSNSFTFINTHLGNMIVKKVMVGGEDDFPFTGGVSGTITTNNGTLETNNVLPGTYSSVEGTKAVWDLNSVTCDDGNSTGDVQSRTAFFNVEAGETVTCTFTNTQRGNIIVDKVTDPTGSSQSFDFTATGSGYVNFSLTDQDTPNDQEVLPGSYAVSEGSVSGWDSNGGSCDMGETPDSLDVGPGETVTCTFTNTQRGSITAHKYEDMYPSDGNDQIIGTDSNLANWDMSLYSGDNCQGAALTTGITGVDGNYSFSNLVADNYSVKETLKDHWQAITSICQNVVVSSGNASTVNFGNFLMGTVNVCKYHDHNGNGDWDLGDTGIQGWTMTAYNTTTDTTYDMLTADNGCALFTDLPYGIYDVSEEVRDGWIKTSPSYSDPRQILITASTSNSIGIGYYNFQLGSISGQKYNDLNKNGVEDSGELGLSGWTINLDKNADGSVDFTTTTDSNGEYSFTNLLAGTYRVREVVQTGWAQMSTDPLDVAITSGLNANDVDFGNIRLGSIHGVKWEDVNGNGVNDSEPLLSGWEVFIDENNNSSWDNGEPKTTTSDDPSHFGWYWFNNLTPGEYKVCEITQLGWEQTYPINPQCHTVTLPDVNPSNFAFSVNMVAGPEYNFGNQRSPVTLKSYKVVCDSEQYLPNWGNHGGTIDQNTAQNWVDQSNGHCRLVDDWKFQWGPEDSGDQGDTFVGEAGNGWTTFGPTVGGVAEVQINDLSVTRGRLEVREVLQSNYIPFTYTVNGNSDVSAEFYCTGDVYHYDNWEWINSPQYGQTYYCVAFNALNYGSFSGKKYIDYNADGQFNSVDGDSVYSGWKITLDKHNGSVWGYLTETTTDGNGEYFFGNLTAGMYRISEEMNSGYLVIDPNAFGLYNAVNLPVGENLTGFDFGNFEKGDMDVWKYEDTDGVLGRTDGQEFWIGDPTFTFRVYKDTGSGWVLKGQEDTDNTGKASFIDIFDSIGNYFVCEVKKAGWEDMRSLHNPANNLSGQLDEYQTCDGITVPGSGYRLVAEFGNIRFGSIHGVKWEDVNGNGVNDSEPLLSGWEVFIDENNNSSWDNGEPKTTTSDDPSHFGWYWFNNLTPGEYKVCEITQLGWEQTYPINPQCHTVTLPDANPGNFLFTLNMVEGPEYNFGNIVSVQLYLYKSNDKPVAHTGDTVTYTLTTTVGPHPLTAMTLVDNLPEGFVYQTGSSTVVGGTVSAVEPTLTNSGKTLTWTWTAVPGSSTVIVTYQAKIDSGNQAASYTNYAYVYGSGSPEGDSEIVDSVVRIDPDISYSTSVGGEVLGAATELPASGSNTWYLILALSLIGTGFVIKKFSRKFN